MCGQENILTHQSFWSLAKHFVFDILHFDGKFFHTLGYLFSRPGFVAKQYVEGKRVSYLDPIRMYLFTSALFFLIFFSVKTFNVGDGKMAAELDADDRKELREKYEKKLRESPGDTVLLQRIAYLRDTTKPVNLDSLGWRENIFRVGSRSYTSLQNYDSVQAGLPEADRDGWIKRRFVRQSFKTNDKYGQSQEGVKSFIEAFLHKLPYLLFVSLPFFAGILKLLYVRRRNFFYSDHAVFTLYHYIFSFLLLLVYFGIDALQTATGWGVLGFLVGLLFLAWPVYLFIEMRRFYSQGFGKTLSKFLALNLLGFILILVLFAIFALFSFFNF